MKPPDQGIATCRHSMNPGKKPAAVSPLIINGTASPCQARRETSAAVPDLPTLSVTVPGFPLRQKAPSTPSAAPSSVPCRYRHRPGQTTGSPHPTPPRFQMLILFHHKLVL